jgi:hypothetical protein
MRDVILNNLPLKVFSLVLAALVWLVLETYQQTGSRVVTNLLHPTESREVRRPVALLAGVAAHRAVAIEPAEVTVKLQGDAAVMQDLKPEDVQAFVRLVGVTHWEGSFLVEVTTPARVSVAQIQPDRVFVRPAGPPDR